jgi:hypothetical protein
VAPETGALSAEERGLIRDAIDFSLLSYVPRVHIESVLKAPEFERVRTMNRRCMQAVCFVRGERVWVVFRGTDNLGGWLLNFTCVPWFRPRRHLGFELAWRIVREEVVAWLAGLDRPEIPLVLAGHSLGGAMAHLAAFEFARAGRRIANVVTLGAPKAAFGATAKIYDATPTQLGGQSLGEVTYHVVNLRDVVARVPPRWMFYRDVGRAIQNDQGGGWKFTSGIDSLVFDAVTFSFDVPQPAAFPPPAAGALHDPLRPGLARSVEPALPRSRAVLEDLCARACQVYPPLRLPLGYVRFLFFAGGAAQNHLGRHYRSGFFLADEPVRFPYAAPLSVFSILFALLLACLAIRGFIAVWRLI